MKAIILAAGVGSRLRPYTDTKPKSLVEVGGKTILSRMIDNILSVGIKDIIVVTGYRSEIIQRYIKDTYPSLNVVFVHNERYEQTNTGYSLLLAKPYVKDDSFIKFDADVVFEKAVLEKLLASDTSNALCIDRNIHLEAEEVKVIVDEGSRVLKVGKKLDPHSANGESIGIEKIGLDGSEVLFSELERLMKDKKNWQEYYDDVYTTIVAKGIPMYAVDITGYKWVEIDTLKDFDTAQNAFSE